MLCRQSVKWGQRLKDFVSRRCGLVQRLCLSLDSRFDTKKVPCLYDFSLIRDILPLNTHSRQYQVFLLQRDTTQQRFNWSSFVHSDGPELKQIHARHSLSTIPWPSTTEVTLGSHSAFFRCCFTSKDFLQRQTTVNRIEPRRQVKDMRELLKSEEGQEKEIHRDYEALEGAI